MLTHLCSTLGKIMVKKGQHFGQIVYFVVYSGRARADDFGELS